MQYSQTLANIIADVLKVQRSEFNKGNTDNSGASIDVMNAVAKLIDHPRYRNNEIAYRLSVEINGFADHLKYAKPLSKFAQTSAYHIVRAAVVKQ